MKIRKKSLLPTVFIVVFILLIYFIGTKVPEKTIREIIHNAGPWGVIVLILLFLLSNIIAPLSGSPFLYAGFYSYGQKVVFYAFIAAIIASVTNFWIARIWGRPLVEKLVGKEGLQKIDSLTKNYGIQTLIIFRLFLKEFHDVISYAYGLSSLKFMPYFIVSTLGMIPATLVWYYISLKINNALTFTVISWLLAYFFLTVYVAIKILLKKRNRLKKQ